MASNNKQTGNGNGSTTTSESISNPSVGFAPNPKMDSVATVVDENDKHSSPSKTADPARKKTFKIISMKKGGSGDTPVDNDADSVDGLDESQTEDWSSEFCDSSKATDLDTDAQDNLIPLTPDEVASTTTILLKQKPDRDSQSRFKVVKIETKEPFRRGKWICYDFFDTVPVVTMQKNGSKMTADSILQSAISGNLSSSSSLHYVHSVNDSSSNIFVPLSPVTGGQAILSKVFVPIAPITTDQKASGNPEGYKIDNMAPFPSQPAALLTSSGVLSSSSSYQNIVHPGQGQTTLVQSLPQTNVFPYTQNPSGTLFQNGMICVPTTGPSGQPVNVNVPDASMLAAAGGNPPSVLQGTSLAGAATTGTAPQDNSSVHQGNNYMQVGGVSVPHSQGHSQLPTGIVTQNVIGGKDGNHSTLAQGGINQVTSSVPSAGVAVPSGHLVPSSMSENVVAFSNIPSTIPDHSGLVGVGMDESTGSTKTLQGDPPTPGLAEAVETMYMELDNPEEVAEEK